MAGIAMMKIKKNATGADLIPNKGFWVSTVGYVKVT